MPDKEAKETPVIGPPGPRTDGRGRHKIFLGYAAGTGKSYNMLDEARRRKSRGQDVIVGIVDPHGRRDTVDAMEGFEKAAVRTVEQGGRSIYELDVPAIIGRQPQLVLVDELQHTNAPGSDNAKRWQDVEEILKAGINVLSTLDVQYLESLNDQVFEISGVRVKDTVPDRIIHEADEVEFVDATPRALIHRLERGDVFPDEEKPENIEKLFREGSLMALRELALREVAARIDEDVMQQNGQAARVERPWAARDRVLICVSPTQSSLRLIRRGWRIGQRLRAEVVAAYVQEEIPSEKMQEILQSDFALSERLNIPVVRLKGEVADALISYAKENGITQLVVGHSTSSRMQELIRPSIVNTLIRELKTIDILVVAHERPTE